jgi:hypothetical protein
MCYYSITEWKQNNTEDDLAYIEIQPSDQTFELCLAFFVVVSVFILFDERIARNEFCLAEL